MKMIAAVVVMVSLFAANAFAAGDSLATPGTPESKLIRNTKHNLSGSITNGYTIKGSGTGSDQICIYCHTPHNSVQKVPLWNRDTGATAGFSFYQVGSKLSAEAKRIATDGVNAGKLPPESFSLFCLGCHDGATTVIGSRVHNKPAGWGASGGTWANGGINFDADGLKNDHPVGFSYAAAYGDILHAPGGTQIDFNTNPSNVAGLIATESQVKLYPSTNLDTSAAIADAIECSSCHLVHNNFNGKFLRMNNGGSKLCLACHMK